MKTVAVILAGGSGKRLGADVPKQFLKVNGKMIIDHTIEAFQNHDQVDEIVIVCHANHITFLEKQVKNSNYSKVKKILAGGKERHESSMVAIKHYNTESECKILFHDAVRPMVSSEIISKCIKNLDIYNAVGAGILTTDTIWEIEDGIIQNVPNRKNIYRAQTPQGFKLSIIKKAYEMSMQNTNIENTDDCGVIINNLPNEQIKIIQGSDQNFKITKQEDLDRLEQYLAIE